MSDSTLRIGCRDIQGALAVAGDVWIDIIPHRTVFILERVSITVSS